jgi:hypothetical protein
VEAEARHNGLLRVARKNVKEILFICMYTLYFNFELFIQISVERGLARIYHEYFARFFRLEELGKVTRPRTKVYNGIEFAFDIQ